MLAMSDKMREEFELINPMPSGVIRCGCSYAATDYGWQSQDYVKAFDAFALGWQASRAALCVELPNWHDDGHGEPMYYESDITNALEASGVRYK